MYTSVQARASNPKSSNPHARWALTMAFVQMKQQPVVNEDHKKVVVSMRDHVMPLIKKYKEDAAVHVRNLLTNQAWRVIIQAVEKANGQSQLRHAGSVGLGSDVKAMADGFKAAGFKTVSLMSHISGNMRQLKSLETLLRDNGLNVELIWSGCDAFMKNTLVIAQSQYIKDVFDLSYHMPGPKSVPDVEGSDTVFIADLKATVNHSEAVANVSWKNYNSFTPDL